MTQSHPLTRILIAAAFWSVCTFGLAGCSLLIGNVKPVDEKSQKYRVLDLSAENPAWARLSARQLAGPESPASESNSDAFSNDITDVVFQNQKTAAIISLNSSCRNARPGGEDLHELTRELLLGLPSSTDRDEKNLKVSGEPALQTTAEGPMAGQVTRIRTVVLRKGECVYDLMYVAKPQQFPKNEADFSRFVSSLDLR